MAQKKVPQRRVGPDLVDPPRDVAPPAPGKANGKYVLAPDAPEDRSILINFVLDKSGSMETIRSATISGFNEFKNDQARAEGTALMTLTLFDTRFDTVATAVPVGNVLDLTSASYAPQGNTALYDAVGHTLRLTDEYVAKHHPDQVLFVIMTDGEENSSREFSRDKIFALIEDRQRDAGYEFIYLGANQDSYLAGRAMGIRAGRMLDYDATPDSARAMMQRTSMNVRAHRKWAAEQAPEMFSATFEAMADLNGEALEAQKAKYVRETSKKK
jgi:uncharacterized protein YegL